MHKVLILACCAVSISFTSPNHRNTTQKLNVPFRNGSVSTIIVGKVISQNSSRSELPNESSSEGNTVNSHINEKNEIVFKERSHFTKETDKTFPLLHKIHARITHSKDAVWATITLTFMCVLLFLAVAQSRMWKDHNYSESQGVPLPNFNERVLFKDVMERKVILLKQFFKKKSKQKNATELESLLPPSEWDN